MNAAWVSDEARQARLQRIEQTYARQVKWLKGQGGAAPDGK
jgi:hypothetical protein